MKVLMMVQLFPPAAIGGAERQCLRQARALARRGHQVMVLTKWVVPESPRCEEMDGITVLRKGYFFSLRKAWRRRRGGEAAATPSGAVVAAVVSTRKPTVSDWLRNALFIAETVWAAKTGRLKADVVHVHMSDWFAGLAEWVGRILRAPVFCKEASNPVLLVTEDLDVPLASYWRARRMGCRFVAMTEAIAEALRIKGISADRIVSIPNGMELPEAVSEPGSRSGAIYLGNFSQGAEFKGFDVLLAAWSYAVREEPAMRLRMHGGGDAECWKAFARERGCEESVDFAGPTGDVWQVHREAGFFVLPSRKEGLSNALLEAMASGLPVVVSDIPGNVAVVQDGVQGLVVPVDDAEALAAAMLKLYRDPGLRVRMGEAARRRIREAFAIDSVAERLEGAYARALAETRKKIAMVVPRYLPLPEGGAERQCRLQARELARRGHDVTIYTRRWSWSQPRVEWMEGVRVVRMGWFYPVEEWVWTLRRRLTGRGKGEYLDGTTVDQIRMKQAERPKRRIRVMALLAWLGKTVHVLAWRLHFSCKSNVPDLWHVHADTWEIVQTAISGAQIGRPVFVKPTGFPLRIAFDPVRFGGAGVAAQRAAFDAVRYLSLTPQIREGLVEMGVEESRIVDLPNGVEMPTGALPLAPARKPIVLVVGNLTQGSSYKAFDVMLEAWSRVVPRHLGAQLHMAGDGDPAPWRALAERLGCADSVRLLGRIRNVGPLYDAAQIFCLPSRVEGISNALLEAQSRGVACVVSDIRANLAVVDDGVNGLVVPVGNAEALAEAVSALLDDPARRARLGAAAVARIRGQFEIGAVVSKLERIYAGGERENGP